MAPDTDEPGLRERKRLATRRAIQHAVLTLALDGGIEKVTVDDISRVAGISARTFFNYFPSKDAALLGDAPHLASDEAIEAFVRGGPDGDILAQVADLLAESLERSEADRELHQLRQTVMKDSAYLFGLRMATLREFEARLLDIVTRRFETDHPERSGTAGLAQRAQLFSLVAVAAMRHAWLCWAEGSAPTLSGCLTSSFSELYNFTRPTG